MQVEYRSCPTNINLGAQDERVFTNLIELMIKYFVTGTH
jgi:hypothetical protein